MMMRTMHSLPYMLAALAIWRQCLDQLHSVYAECDATPQRLKSNGTCVLQSEIAVLSTDCLVIRQSLELVACLNQPIVNVDSIVGASIEAQWLLA